MNEATRRKKLAEALSPENMQALCVTAGHARVTLLRYTVVSSLISPYPKSHI